MSEHAARPLGHPLRTRGLAITLAVIAVGLLFAGQRFLYLADAGHGKIRIYDRATLTEVGAFGRIGRYAGQFIFLHALAVDSRGDLYAAEVGTGRRVQKFVRR